MGKLVFLKNRRISNAIDARRMVAALMKIGIGITSTLILINHKKPTYGAYFI